MRGVRESECCGTEGIVVCGENAAGGRRREEEGQGTRNPLVRAVSPPIVEGPSG